METLFVTESRELLFTGTEDIDVRPLHSPVLHYEGDSREVALRAAHEAAAASKVEACQRGFARWVATVSEITLDGEEFTESEETVNTVDPLDRVPELRTLARETADRDARTGRSSAISPGIRSRSDPRGAAGTSTASTASRGRPSVTSRATGSDARPTTGRSTFPRGSTITASPPCAGFSPRSRADSANSCANTRTRSMGSITGSSRRGSKMKGTDMQTIHTKAGFKVLRESLGLYQSDVAQAAGVDVKTVKNWESPRLPRCRATAEAWKYLENLAEVQEREVGCLVEKIVGETDVNPYPLPYFREQDLAAEDARAARISNAMTRKVAFELTRLAIPYEFRFEEEAADDERLSEIRDM